MMTSLRSKWALARLEKQPTDPASAGRCHHCMRDGTPAFLKKHGAHFDEKYLWD
jgi:hypothetical protein